MTEFRISTEPKELLEELDYLKGRTALVTGGARRIGRAMVLGLARRGADVVIHYNTSKKAAGALAEEVEAVGKQAFLISGDLLDSDVAIDLIAMAREEAGKPIDILVNNASIFEQCTAEEASLEEWERHLDVNLRAPFLLAQSFASELPDGVPADIINLNDTRALRPGSDYFAYTISKVGLHGLTQVMALALAPRIRVNELALGAILPPEKAPDEYVHTLREEIPIRRFCKPEEVADALVFLLGNPGITGQTVSIDGGWHLV